MSARKFASGNLSLHRGTHPCWVRTSDTCHCGANFRDVSIGSITTCVHVKDGKGATLCFRNDGGWENTHTTSSACALLTSSSALGGCRWLASSRRVSTMRQASRKQAAVAFKNKAPFARERACVRSGVIYSETYGVSG
jgi:hypothetical protein